MIQTVYGAGGFCENCDTTHDHPLNNIIEIIEIQDEPAIQMDVARKSAIDKLTALGLTTEEIAAIIGAV